MYSIRHELENYLTKIYPDTQIDTEHSFGGKITIRINTSEEETVETNQRISQAVSRATLIWNKLFGKTQTPLWIISYKYDDRVFFVWADEPTPLREIYETHSDWISNHTRGDIEEYFN